MGTPYDVFSFSFQEAAFCGREGAAKAPGPVVTERRLSPPRVSADRGREGSADRGREGAAKIRVYGSSQLRRGRLQDQAALAAGPVVTERWLSPPRVSADRGRAGAAKAPGPVPAAWRGGADASPRQRMLPRAETFAERRLALLGVSVNTLPGPAAAAAAPQFSAKAEIVRRLQLAGDRRGSAAEERPVLQALQRAAKAQAEARAQQKRRGAAGFAVYRDDEHSVEEIDRTSFATPAATVTSTRTVTTVTHSREPFPTPQHQQPVPTASPSGLFNPPKTEFAGSRSGAGAATRENPPAYSNRDRPGGRARTTATAHRPFEPPPSRSPPRAEGELPSELLDASGGRGASPGGARRAEEEEGLLPLELLLCDSPEAAAGGGDEEGDGSPAAGVRVGKLLILQELVDEFIKQQQQQRTVHVPRPDRRAKAAVAGRHRFPVGEAEAAAAARSQQTAREAARPFDPRTAERGSRELMGGPALGSGTGPGGAERSVSMGSGSGDGAARMGARGPSRGPGAAAGLEALPLLRKSPGSSHADLPPPRCRRAASESPSSGPVPPDRGVSGGSAATHLSLPRPSLALHAVPAGARSVSTSPLATENFFAHARGVSPARQPAPRVLSGAVAAHENPTLRFAARSGVPAQQHRAAMSPGDFRGAHHHGMLRAGGGRGRAGAVDAGAESPVSASVRRRVDFCESELDASKAGVPAADDDDADGESDDSLGDTADGREARSLFEHAGWPPAAKKEDLRVERTGGGQQSLQPQHQPQQQPQQQPRYQPQQQPQHQLQHHPQQQPQHQPEYQPQQQPQHQLQQQPEYQPQQQPQHQLQQQPEYQPQQQPQHQLQQQPEYQPQQQPQHQLQQQPEYQPQQQPQHQLQQQPEYQPQQQPQHQLQQQPEYQPQQQPQHQLQHQPEYQPQQQPQHQLQQQPEYQPQQQPQHHPRQHPQHQPEYQQPEYQLRRLDYEAEPASIVREEDGTGGGVPRAESSPTSFGAGAAGDESSGEFAPPNQASQQIALRIVEAALRASSDPRRPGAAGGADGASPEAESSPPASNPSDGVLSGTAEAAAAIAKHARSPLLADLDGRSLHGAPAPQAIALGTAELRPEPARERESSGRGPSRGGERKHEHEHDRDHEYEHKPTHDPAHKHEHDHEYDHEHKHERKHDLAHKHDHEYDHKHERDHEHEHGEEETAPGQPRRPPQLPRVELWCAAAAEAPPRLGGDPPAPASPAALRLVPSAFRQLSAGALPGSPAPTAPCENSAAGSPTAASSFLREEIAPFDARSPTAPGTPAAAALRVRNAGPAAANEPGDPISFFKGRTPPDSRPAVTRPSPLGGHHPAAAPTQQHDTAAGRRDSSTDAPTAVATAVDSQEEPAAFQQQNESAAVAGAAPAEGRPAAAGQRPGPKAAPSAAAEDAAYPSFFGGPAPAAVQQQIDSVAVADAAPVEGRPAAAGQRPGPKADPSASAAYPSFFGGPAPAAVQQQIDSVAVADAAPVEGRPGPKSAPSASAAYPSFFGGQTPAPGRQQEPADLRPAGRFPGRRPGAFAGGGGGESSTSSSCAVEYAADLEPGSTDGSSHDTHSPAVTLPVDMTPDHPPSQDEEEPCDDVLSSSVALPTASPVQALVELDTNESTEGCPNSPASLPLNKLCNASSFGSSMVTALEALSQVDALFLKDGLPDPGLAVHGGLYKELYDQERAKNETLRRLLVEQERTRSGMERSLVGLLESVAATSQADALKRQHSAPLPSAAAADREYHRSRAAALSRAVLPQLAGSRRPRRHPSYSTLLRAARRFARQPAIALSSPSPPALQPVLTSFADDACARPPALHPPPEQVEPAPQDTSVFTANSTLFSSPESVPRNRSSLSISST
ncbi:zinc finger protein [Diplonema papillatum]|nr:zinc finger protein [Diplonema papillatum]